MSKMACGHSENFTLTLRRNSRTSEMASQHLRSLCELPVDVVTNHRPILPTVFVLRVMVIFAVFAPQLIVAGFARSVASETCSHMRKFNIVLGMCADLSRHDVVRFGEVVEIDKSLSASSSRGTSWTRLSRELTSRQRAKRNTPTPKRTNTPIRDDLELFNVDHVTTNAKPSQFVAMLYIFEDNEAVIKMVIRKLCCMCLKTSKQ